MKELPKIHTSIVSIPDVEDPESIAFAAAHAALEILIKVSADARGSTQLDRVQIVQPTSISALPNFTDFFGLTSIESPHRRSVPSGHAVMVSCRVVPPKPKEEPEGSKPDDSKEAG